MKIGIVLAAIALLAGCHRADPSRDETPEQIQNDADHMSVADLAANNDPQMGARKIAMKVWDSRPKLPRPDQLSAFQAVQLSPDTLSYIYDKRTNRCFAYFPGRPASYAQVTCNVDVKRIAGYIK